MDAPLTKPAEWAERLEHLAAIGKINVAITESDAGGGLLSHDEAWPVWTP